ncbi:MAG: 6,7-dimethyl-8-ribityllumazine synthase [Nitrospirae bacterium]|nr:6,7-dimethyl-8-ribityllumazine synthase [Nitrospirota bacterium]
MKVIEGDLNASGLRICMIVSRFNDFITSHLLDGAVDAYLRHGGKDENITVIKVPGSFEIPMTALKAAKSGKFDAVVTLAAIIRGATPHFEYVSAEASKGIAMASIESGIPVSYGVITSDSIEQAIERAGSKSGNKGWDAAVTAIEMANVIKSL